MAQRNPLTFVATIGLMETPAYVYAVWRLHRLNVIVWRREITALMTIMVGASGGFAASYVGRLLFPNL
jgi:hypothetical protein